MSERSKPSPRAYEKDAPRLRRRAALEGVGAVGLLRAVGATTALVGGAMARADERGSAERNRARPEPTTRERTLRAHDLAPLDAQTLASLRACEAAGVDVVEAFAPRRGGLPFVVEIREGHGHPDAGARRAFELLRHDAAGDAPLASFGAVALVMENRGDGRTPTAEDDARLALRMASALAPHAAALSSLPLLTARERRTRAPHATLHVPLRG